MNFPSWLCENDDPEDNTNHEDVGVLYDVFVDTYNIEVHETESDSEYILWTEFWLSIIRGFISVRR